jgi:hypothetical protein
LVGQLAVVLLLITLLSLVGVLVALTQVQVEVLAVIEQALHH